MKKYLFIIIILFSCSTEKENVSHPVVEKQAEVIPDVEIETTEYPFKVVEIPFGFYVDTIIWTDTIRCASFQFQHLVQRNKAESKLERYHWKQFKEEFIYEMSYVDSCDLEFDFPAYDVVIGLKNIYILDKIISVQYVKDSYGEGGNHHNYGYFTLNYNTSIEKPIYMEDILTLKSESDTSEFLKLLKENQVVENCMEIHFFEGRMDFTVQDSGIQFSPYAPWACGMNYCFLNWEQMEGDSFFNLEMVR
jgi:hypothetical protein